MNGNRRAVAFLGLDHIARMLALPDGLRVIACRDDFMRDGVAVLIEGDALDEAEPGAELPRLPVELVDRSKLAMAAEVRSWESEGVTFIETYCPAGCPWERTWEHSLSLAQLADTVQLHLDEAHA